MTSILELLGRIADPELMPRPLYHFTCEHAAHRILNDDTLRLQSSSLGIWLTDLESPTRHALGLTSHSLRCDRMEYRFTVPAPVEAVPWLAVQAMMPPLAQALSDTPGAMPMHWWISADPQRVTEWRRSPRRAFDRGASR